MALKKAVVKKNGLTLAYHRIHSLYFEVNNKITMEVQSYVSEEAREYDKNFRSGLIAGEVNLPYIHHDFYELEYNENLTIKKAYHWLKKNAPDLADAEDV